MGIASHIELFLARDLDTYGTPSHILGYRHVFVELSSREDQRVVEASGTHSQEHRPVNHLRTQLQKPKRRQSWD